MTACYQLNWEGRSRGNTGSELLQIWLSLFWCKALLLFFVTGASEMLALNGSGNTHQVLFSSPNENANVRHMFSHTVFMFKNVS